ncbi:hypothetical protein [Flavobacterium yafengii]|uniref:hypothetical protein n=1 Tax=Flavobacterium yafengii TaxID=3041253 RepID=UPI0024A8EF95|nr:hypothetical protein [Flavobacterium yafengii]MDI5899644.1 hypothetical protein [Flavobacterium yafengii]
MKTKQKTGGRVAGTPNRTTAETKELIQKIVSKELENIADFLEKLDPKERIDAIIKLMNFVIPKQSEIAVEAKMNQIDLSTMTTAELVERAKAIKDAN